VAISSELCLRNLRDHLDFRLLPNRGPESDLQAVARSYS